MRRWHLSKRDRRRLFEQLRQLYGSRADRLTQLLGDATLEKLVEDDVEMYLADGKPALIELVVDDETIVIPHLLLLLDKGYDWLPFIVVDEGAVRPISRGADLMRPGIVEFSGDFSRGDVVVIVDPNHKLPLAVHRALYSRAEIESMERGRVTKSLHHVGDRFWKIGKSL